MSAWLLAAAVVWGGTAVVVLPQSPTSKPPCAGVEQAPVKPAEEPQVKLGEPATDEKAARERAVERARKRLAEELALEPDAITLESVKAATWPDASLGCPQKGQMYAQVLSDGFIVVLKAAEQTHELHVSRTRIVSCKKTDGE